VTVVGTVTTRQGLLDVDGDRVAVQDSSGAILVRLPNDFGAQVGQKLRVSGEVGTYYGAPQLTADSASREGQGNVAPASVRSSPFASSLEWRLVTITGVVQDLHRDGEAWRAEVTVGDGSVPVAGIERSGIAPDTLVEGRAATIVGVVKRAYPTSSDQRFALVPRSAADIRLGPAPATARPDGSSSPSDGPAPGATPDGEGGLSPWPGSLTPGESAGPDDPPAAGATPGGEDTIPVADVAGHIGERVTVGGFVTAIDGARLTVQDETAATVVRVSGDAMVALESIGVGDLINATGVADRNAAGGIEISVSEPSGIFVLPARATVVATLHPSAEASAQSSPPALGSTPTTPTAGPNGIAALILLCSGGLLAATLVATPHNRTRIRKWLEEASITVKQRLGQLRSS
jgi:hypothetical protein